MNEWVSVSVEGGEGRERKNDSMNNEWGSQIMNHYDAESTETSS